MEFRKHSIVFRVIVICLILVFLLFSSSGIILAFQLYFSFKEENTVYLNSLAKNTSASISSILSNANKINRMLLNHVETQDILFRCQQADYTIQDYQMDSANLSYIMTTLSVGENIFFASFFDKDGNRLFQDNTFARMGSHNLFEDPWIAEHREQIDQRSIFFVSSNQLSQEPFRGYHFCMIIRPLVDLNRQVFAYIAVYVDSREFTSVLKQNFYGIQNGNSNSSVYAIRLVDSDGNIVSSTQLEEEGISYRSLDIHGDELCIQMKDFPFTVNLESNPSFFWQSLSRTLTILFSALLLLLGFFSFFIVMLLNRIFFPLKQLTSAMVNVSCGDFNTKLDESICLDMDSKQIYHGFNHMTEKIDSLIKNVYNQQIELKSAQLQSLKYQINPHFLYNTLQTLEAIGEIKNFPEIQIISTSLAQMFRYNLKEENLVPLKDEISHLETYFAIEKIRFRDQIQFSVELDPKLSNIFIPKFILQPIAENAILHGFRRKKEAYLIRIFAYQKEQQLFLEISDNGVGIPPAQLEDLQVSLANARNWSPCIRQDAIGLLNVQNRIVNISGPEYGIKIQSILEKGTTVIVCLPVTE